MTDPNEHDERRFLAALRAHWPSPRLLPAQEAAFDARLWQRIRAGSRPRLRVWATLVAAAAGVAAMLWWASPATEPVLWIDALAEAEQEIETAGATTAFHEGVAWLSTPPTGTDLAPLLPPQYQAMAEWLAPGASTSTALNPQK